MQTKEIKTKSYQLISAGDVLKNKITGEFETILDCSMYEHSNVLNSIYLTGKVYFFKAALKTFEHDKGNFLVYGG